ncbi:MAG TPA: hypothetical protein VFV68_16425 [Agriterribacter sp.]|nr:hypothetical protein [Agriterribacter sp.]
MTQPYQSRSQRITMLVTLLVLVIVIAIKVQAGTECMVAPEDYTSETQLPLKVMDDLTGMKDIPWRPLMSLLW